MGPSDRSNIRHHLPFIVALLLLSLGLRILPYYSMVFTGEGPIIRDPDACYHLRRAELILHSFPAIPVFDSYMNHPFGAYIIWPPLYDLLIAGVWGVLNLFPGQSSPPGGLPFLPPFLFALAGLVVYRMGLRLWPGQRWLAFGAALAPVVLPIVVLYSYVGQLDHHAAEFLCVALFMDALFINLPKLRKGFEPSWIIPGLIFGLGLLVQHGLLLLEAVLFFSLLPSAGVRTRSKIWVFGGVVNAVAFAVTLPFGLYYYVRGVPLAHTHFGLFQPLVALEMALFYSTLWLGLAPPTWLSHRWRSPARVVTAALTLVLATYLLHHTLAGTTYLVRTWSGWQAQIAESHSLVRISLTRAFDELSRYMSWAVFLLPLGWVMMLSRWRRLSPQEWTLFLSTLTFAVFGLFQIRFLPYLALLLGLMVAFLFQTVRKRLPYEKPFLLFTAIVLTVSYYPCAESIGAKDVTFEVYNQMSPILRWLREKSPPDSLYFHPDTSPEYGVVSDWNLGHYIQYYGHWPVLADNFGEHATDLSRLNRFFFSTDNEETYRFLDKNSVRYVLCQDLPSMYQSMILDGSVLAYVSDFDRSTGRIVFAPKMFPTVLCRLVWRYGAAFIDVEKGTYYPPLDRLRLVAESRGRDETLRAPEVARIKLFEYVPGARLRVTGLPPDTEIVLSAKVRTPHGRMFPYIQLQRSDSLGNLSATLPYPNRKENSPYAEEYRLLLGNQKKVLSPVTERMVLEGQRVEEVWE